MEEKTSRDSFVFYRSFNETISKCPEDIQFVLIQAVINYGLDRIIPDFSNRPYQQFLEAIWAGIQPQLDANYKKYINGRKGGAPIGNQNARKQPKTTENNQKQANVNENENENVNVNDNELDHHFSNNCREDNDHYKSSPNRNGEPVSDLSQLM